MGIPILLENTHDHIKKDNVLTDEEKENILENIIPVKRRKDITSINNELQDVYKYINRIFCHLNSKIESEQLRIETIYNEKISELEAKIDSAVVSLNSRMLIAETDIEKMQSNVNNLLNSQKGRLESTHLNALKN